MGLQDLVRRSCVGLNRRLRLECDGVEVPLPPDAEGLVVLNIGCHMVRGGDGRVGGGAFTVERVLADVPPVAVAGLVVLDPLPAVTCWVPPASLVPPLTFLTSKEISASGKTALSHPTPADPLCPCLSCTQTGAASGRQGIACSLLALTLSLSPTACILPALPLPLSAHQGGVFLWDEGLPAPRIDAPGGAALTRERHPSLHDEVRGEDRPRICFRPRVTFYYFPPMPAPSPRSPPHFSCSKSLLLGACCTWAAWPLACPGRSGSASADQSPSSHMSTCRCRWGADESFHLHRVVKGTDMKGRGVMQVWGEGADWTGEGWGRRWERVQVGMGPLAGDR